MMEKFMLIDLTILRFAYTDHGPITTYVHHIRTLPKNAVCNFTALLYTHQFDCGWCGMYTCVSSL